MNNPDVAAAKRHQPRLVLSHDVHAAVHGSGPAGRFNTWIPTHFFTSSIGD